VEAIKLHHVPHPNILDQNRVGKTAYELWLDQAELFGEAYEGKR
jgi:hypothetical protein